MSRILPIVTEYLCVYRWIIHFQSKSRFCANAKYLQRLILGLSNTHTHARTHKFTAIYTHNVYTIPISSFTVECQLMRKRKASIFLTFQSSPGALMRGFPFSDYPQITCLSYTTWYIQIGKWNSDFCYAQRHPSFSKMLATWVCKTFKFIWHIMLYNKCAFF